MIWNIQEGTAEIVKNRDTSSGIGNLAYLVELCCNIRKWLKEFACYIRPCTPEKRVGGIGIFVLAGGREDYRRAKSL